MDLSASWPAVGSRGVGLSTCAAGEMRKKSKCWEEASVGRGGKYWKVDKIGERCIFEKRQSEGGWVRRG